MNRPVHLGPLCGSPQLDEARRWLEMGDVRSALEILLRDPRASKPVLVEAAKVLLHSAEPELAAQHGGDLGSRLFKADEHTLATQVGL